jgi:hypothetical protein
VTIKGSPKYVNDRALALKLVWPAGAKAVTLSDSAGSPAKSVTIVGTNASWRLGGKGTSKRPTTIRAQYDWPLPATVYETKVVLDLERPKLTKATLSGHTLHLAAHDAISGLARAQIAVDRKKPRSVEFSKALRVRAAKWIRVSDRAGNFSAWRRVRSS